MLEAVTSGLTTVVGWCGTVVDALVTTEGDLNGLLGLFCIGVACTAVKFGIGIVRSFTWGD